MSTITEDYVSFEIAKLLKEKGFDSEEVGCHGGFYSERYYHSGYGIITDSGQEVGIVYDDLRNTDLEYDEYLRPTLQMAIKWLREEKRTSIIIEFDLTKRGYCPYVHQLDYDMDWVVKWRVNTPMKYEQAIEAALKYSLENLI